MNNALTLAYSPCPNDTFIFGAIANGLIDLRGFDFDIHLGDVEQLNQACKEARYHISKISIAAYLYLQRHYALLYSGSALGRGCGPLIVARPDKDIQDLTRGLVAVPGLMTTAYLLLCLFAGNPLPVTPIPFETIMPAVAQGDYDYGVIIHEGRFTYHTYGLKRLIDLGEWWEGKTGLPLPLGAIAIKRDLGEAIARNMDSLINESLEFARENPEAVKPYIKRHAQEMDDNVINQHIELYVNEFSVSLGEEGEKAITELLKRGSGLGVLPSLGPPIMAY